jgi:hypothetical protein
MVGMSTLNVTALSKKSKADIGIPIPLKLNLIQFDPRFKQ